jgi:hypothetical protein
MLIWIIVAVIPLALLGSLLGSSGGARRERDEAEESWWASGVEHRARPDRVPKPEEALDG